MQYVVELELWSPPGRATSPVDGKAVAEECRAATALAQNVVLGLSFIPDHADITVLAKMLEENESTKHQFELFCQQQALPKQPTNPTSAAHYVAFVEGQPLAWLHFPAGAEGQSMALLVCRWASSIGHIIRKGQGEPALSPKEVAALWES